MTGAGSVAVLAPFDAAAVASRQDVAGRSGGGSAGEVFSDAVASCASPWAAPGALLSAEVVDWAAGPPLEGAEDEAPDGAPSCAMKSCRGWGTPSQRQRESSKQRMR
jgi:hypothetical protein